MARGIDIRAAGSGNIGATNVFRVLGKAAGISVLAVDGVKGFAAARWVPLLAGKWFPGTPQENLALAIWGIVFLCTRYVSAASLVAAVVLPLAVWLFHYGARMTLVMTTLAVLV